MRIASLKQNHKVTVASGRRRFEWATSMTEVTPRLNVPRVSHTHAVFENAVLPVYSLGRLATKALQIINVEIGRDLVQLRRGNPAFDDLIVVIRLFQIQRQSHCDLAAVAGSNKPSYLLKPQAYVPKPLFRQSSIGLALYVESCGAVAGRRPVLRIDSSYPTGFTSSWRLAHFCVSGCSTIQAGNVRTVLNITVAFR